jgi:hypothetical protein
MSEYWLKDLLTPLDRHTISQELVGELLAWWHPAPTWERPSSPRQERFGYAAAYLAEALRLGAGRLAKLTRRRPLEQLDVSVMEESEESQRGGAPAGQWPGRSRTADTRIFRSRPPLRQSAASE